MLLSGIGGQFSISAANFFAHTQIVQNGLSRNLSRFLRDIERQSNIFSSSFPRRPNDPFPEDRPWTEERRTRFCLAVVLVVPSQKPSH